MSVSLTLDPTLRALVTALGLVDADGRVVPGWFDHPLDAIGRALRDPTQRAAVFALLDTALPADDGAGPPGARWHPLLDPDGTGQVYLTVTDDVVGVAAVVGTGTGPPNPPGVTEPAVRLTVAVPLLDTAGGALRPIAGTADGPLTLDLDAWWDPAARPSGIAVTVRLDAQDGIGLRIALRDVDLGAGPLPLVELDPARFGADAARVLVGLLSNLFRGATVADPVTTERLRLARVLKHLPGLLGLDGDPLPVAELVRDPGALRRWLTAIGADPARLRAWFTHLAGLLGGGLPAAGQPDPGPTVVGDGTVEVPLRTRLLSFGPGAGLDLVLAAALDPATGAVTLTPGVRLDVAAGGARIEATAELASVPLGGAAPATVLPAARLRLVNPGGGRLVDDAPALQVGSLAAGVRWDGARLIPELTLTQVVRNGRDLGSLDLTDTGAVLGMAQTALTDAIGRTEAGARLLILTGLDPAAPFPTTIDRFAVDPTGAIADVHRRALIATPPAWAPMLAEVAGLLGRHDPVEGGGVETDPWRVRIASVGDVALQLVAWDARTAATPPGSGLLRIGLRLYVERAPVRGWWLTELLAFDIPAAGVTSCALLAGHHLRLASGQIGPAGTALGTTIAADGVELIADWVGGTARCDARLSGLVVTAEGDTVGPLSLSLRPNAFDPRAADLGLGLDPADLVALLRMLVRHALLSWGDRTAMVVGALAGLHRDLPDLPADWPLLAPPDPADVGSLFADPLGALRRHLERVARGTSADGTSFAVPALAWLRAVLASPAAPGEAAEPAWPVAGTGSGTDPWALPLAAAGDAAAGLEALVWLEPAGVPQAALAAAADRVRAATDGPELLALAPALAGVLPGLAAALADRGDATGTALDELAEWLGIGDGLVPLASQLAVGPSWRTGDPLGSAHLDQPADPGAVAQIQAQLDGWAGPGQPRTVLLVAPPYADHRIWAELLAAVEPGRPPDAHVDLRAPGVDPLTVDLAGVAALAGHYTVDLADSDGSGDTVAQLERVAGYLAGLTGRARVQLVGHGPAGVTCRVLAARRQDLVAGVITLGTPHTGSPLAPLAEPALAEAARLAVVLTAADPPDPANPTLRAAHQLVALLDRRPVATGPALPPDLLPALFAGVPTGLVDPGPGLALGGTAGASLVGALATALADRAAAAPPPAPPSHLRLGVRARLPAAGPDLDGLTVDATVRVDATRMALAPGAGDPAPARRVEVRVVVARIDGWLLGGPGPGPRIRRAELGAVLEPAAGGGVSCRPLLRLDEAGGTGPWVDLVAAADRLAATLPRVPLTLGPPASGTGAALLLRALEAVGLVTVDGAGARTLDLTELAAIAAQPTARLGPRLPSLLDAVAALLGAAGPAGGPWSLRPAGLPLLLTLAQNPWTLGLRVDGEPAVLGAGLTLRLDAAVAVPAVTARADVELRGGPATLRWSGADRTLALSGPDWPEPIRLVPAPDPATLRDQLAGALPPLILGAALAAVLETILPPGLRVGPVHRLLSAPGTGLAAALGAADGSGPDSARIAALLRGLAAALGLPADTGLGLPGGMIVVVEPDPVVVRLTESFLLGVDGDTLTWTAGVRIDPSFTVVPDGGFALTVALPGSWGKLRIDFAVDPSGLALAVAPDPDAVGAAPITLLPRFSGFGALAEQATRLLPALLQELVVRFRPTVGQPTGPLAAALEVATALGVYADDAKGFTAPARAAELARMLEPGWWAGRAGAAPAVVRAVAGLFGPAPLWPPALGSVSGANGLLDWQADLAGGGTLVATLGWDASGPVLVVTLSDVPAGPVVVDKLAAGYHNGLVCRLRLRLGLAAGGELGFLRPAIDADGAGGRFTLDMLPLGADRAAELTVRLAPDPGVNLGPDGALALLLDWGVPLAATALLRAFAEHLDTALWTAADGTPGPDARALLEESGLVKAGVLRPPPLADQLPDPAAMALRALARAATGAQITIPPDLTLKLVADPDTGRYGLRLRGRIRPPDSNVTVLFGDVPWLESDGGLTLWLLAKAPLGEAVPVKLRPGLRVTGLGLLVAGRANAPLVQGIVEVGALGGVVFLDAEFLDQGQPALVVTGGGAGVEVHAARLVLAADDGDGFLQKVLPPQLQAPFDLQVGWRSGSGLVLRGGTRLGAADLELAFPLDVGLLAVRIIELYLALRAGAGRARVEAALSAMADIGPVHASISRVGVAASFGAGGIGLAFRAPDGVGLTIDAGPVTGGGFLYVDEARGQYTGGLQIRVAALGLTAIGLLNTKWPDGSPVLGPDGRPGFSLLVVLAFDLPAIQLGFGFTLNGVGGVLGLNRTMDVEALRAGVRNRALDAMLFPPKPLDPPAIVRTLSTVFPPAPGRFVIGPMVRLGWGTPALLTLDLAVLIEVPAPVKIAVLGRMRLALPPGAPEPVIEINLDAAGVLDIERGEVSIDAVLYDSRIALFTLSGGMALRVRWRDRPTFALSLGGFHPAFAAPADFPRLDRIAISLVNRNEVQIRLETYLAVTSNTVQFGARVDLALIADPFRVTGVVAFDALIQFVPFGLQVDLLASLAVTFGDFVVCGITLSAQLSGPSPWRIRGTAEIHVLGLTAGVRVDETIGEAALPPPPPPEDVRKRLITAVGQPANWSALPPGGDPVVTLRARPAETQVVAHPLGGLAWRQRVAPLGIRLAHYGPAAVLGTDRFAVSAVTLRGGVVPGERLDVLRDAFAPAQFVDVADPLTAPSFEEFPSGVEILFPGVAYDSLGAAGAATLDYEVYPIDIDPPVAQARPAAPAPRPSIVLGGPELITLAPSGAAATKGVTRIGERRFQEPPAVVALLDARFAAIDGRTPDPQGASANSGIYTAGTYTEAAQHAAARGAGWAVARVPGPTG